jgi:hypothetical protein
MPWTHSGSRVLSADQTRSCSPWPTACAGQLPCPWRLGRQCERAAHRRVPARHLRLQGRGDRRFRRPPRGVLRGSPVRSGAGGVPRRGRQPPGAGPGRVHGAAELQLRRSAGHGRLPHPGRVRDEAGDPQPTAARVRRLAPGLDAVDERLHGLVGVRGDGPARRPPGHEPEGAGPGRVRPQRQGTHRSPGRPGARLPDQPSSGRRRRAHRDGRRHHLGHGDGIPPAAPRRLGRSAHRRGREGDGVFGGLRPLPRRPGARPGLAR